MVLPSRLAAPFALAVLAACRTAAPTPTIDADFSARVPTAAIALAGIDLDLLRASPVYAKLPPARFLPHRRAASPHRRPLPRPRPDRGPRSPRHRPRPAPRLPGLRQTAACRAGLHRPVCAGTPRPDRVHGR